MLLIGQISTQAGQSRLGKVVISMTQTSVLDKRFFMQTLHTAQRALERDGELVPMLFVQRTSGAQDCWILRMPDTYEKKKTLFLAIGSTLRKSKGPFTEAVMRMESWYVNAQKAPNAKEFLPSRHPCLQEALVLVGRNADNSRQSTVVAPFTRDPNDKVIWGDIPLAQYNHPVEAGNRAVGLLDFLFVTGKQI